MAPASLRRPQRRIRVKADAVYEAELQAECDRIWQVHEGAGGWPAFKALWPNRSTFKSNWPDLAFDLIVADWKIRSAYSDALEVPVDVIDPPPPAPAAEWQATYNRELMDHMGFSRALVDGLGAVIRRAKLSSTYATVLRLWLEGESDANIAKAIRRRPRFVPELRREAMAAVVATFRLPEPLYSARLRKPDLNTDVVAVSLEPLVEAEIV